MRAVVFLLLILAVPAPGTKASFEAYLRVLQTAPAPLKSSPYSDETETNLLTAYQREYSDARAQVPATLAREERNARLSEIMKAKNALVAQKLSEVSLPGNASGIPAIANEVFRILSTNRVSRVDAVGRYDRNGDVGFCFGRAAMVHYLLLKHGIAPERIAKIFVVGRLLYFGRVWEFHVATMVLGEKGQWWVIDNLYDRVQPHFDWMKRVHELDAMSQWPQLRFYVTDPRKFQPALGKYNRAQFEIPLLRPFFSDLFQSLKAGS